MNGCGCNYWKELIKSAWGLATTSVRAAKTKDGTRYPDGDGVLDISDIAGGGEGTVTGVNGKQPDAQGNVTVGSGDIATPDGTVQGDIETLGTNLASEISARASGDEALQTAVDGKQDKLTAGANVQITGNTISATDTKYTLPTASSTTLGGVKVGTGLTITDGVLNATGTTAGVSSVNGKTGAVTIGASDVLSTAQLNAANSGITASKVTAYDGYSTSKQNTLSTAQLNAANSGITSAKVGTYDGYATTIAGKQDKLTAGSNITISGNTISATDTKYTLPTASASVLGGVKVGSGLSISNGVLSATGGGGGGASLPADGYYWEKITAENWPTDWNDTDILLIDRTYILHRFKSSSWTSGTPVPLNTHKFKFCILLSPSGTVQYGYYDIYKHYCVNFYKFELKSAAILNSSNNTTVVLTVSEGALNGAASFYNSEYISITINDLISTGTVYRLHPFSSS